MQTYRNAFRPVLILIFILLNSLSPGAGADTITFKARDAVLISADRYTPLPADTPLIVLFHQAGSSRGEYRQIAPRLNQLGFNAIAIDQRAGKSALGVINQTAVAAANAGLETSYINAFPDMIDSLEYARKQYPNAKLIAWGSSYHAALALKIAGDQTDLVDAVLAFSPGEYFARQGKSARWIQDAAENIRVPVLISSARDEAAQWAAIYAAITPALRNQFVPDTAGKHGSKALWAMQSDSEAYWTAVSDFLRSLISET